jgi:mannose-1-phosphate guanylyltransferase
MKALLLIGGQATRLWPLSKHTPKSLLPICDRELLYYQITQLVYAGISDIVLATGSAHAEELQEFTAGFHGGLQFHYSVESEPRGTAGAIAEAAPFIAGESVVVLNADILSDVLIGKVIEQHFAAGVLATVVGTQVKDPSRYGLLRTAEQALLGFSEKPEGALPPGPHHINAGIYVLHPDVVASIPQGRAVSIERQVFPRLLAEAGEQGFYAHDGFWMDIGTFESYFQAQFSLLGRRYVTGDDWLWGVRDDCAVFKDQIYVYKTATLGQSADLFHRVVAMADVTIGAGVHLRDCVLMPGAAVGESARVESSLIGPGVAVPDEAQVQNMVLVKGEEPLPFFPYAADVPA